MNEELEFLQSLMKKYDKELKTSRNINFTKDFYYFMLQNLNLK